MWLDSKAVGQWPDDAAGQSQDCNNSATGPRRIAVAGRVIHSSCPLGQRAVVVSS
jgi:hypothetical protein